jgi:hypothetical protein
MGIDILIAIFRSPPYNWIRIFFQTHITGGMKTLLKRIIAKKWLALRPEERRWLYFKAYSEAGLAEQMNKGWRKALYCALSDGSAIRVGPKISPKVKKQEEQENMSLFELMKGTA